MWSDTSYRQDILQENLFYRLILGTCGTTDREALLRDIYAVAYVGGLLCQYYLLSYVATLLGVSGVLIRLAIRFETGLQTWRVGVGGWTETGVPHTSSLSLWLAWHVGRGA